MKTCFIGIIGNIKNVSSIFSMNKKIVAGSYSCYEILKNFNVIPILISPSIDLKNIKSLCEKLDGIIFSPGEDIDPESYNAECLIEYNENIKGMGSKYLRPSLFAPNSQRDKFELDLYYEAKKRKIPMLGICRGMQLMNIAEGGSLYQELPDSAITHFIDDDNWIHSHNISINCESYLYKLLKCSEYVISSVHHQAIHKLAPSLVASAIADDGIIEMIEMKEKNQFIIGIQGHLEKTLNNYPAYKNIVAEFVKQSMKEESHATQRIN